jgi:hypothetical protein
MRLCRSMSGEAVLHRQVSIMFCGYAAAPASGASNTGNPDGRCVKVCRYLR